MCDHGSTVVLATPDWLWAERASPMNGISIDACIADQIATAWTHGVRTLGSCCGHGETPPNVVLTGDVEQVALAQRVLPGWTLYQWQLVDVSAPK